MKRAIGNTQGERGVNKVTISMKEELEAIRLTQNMCVVNVGGLVVANVYAEPRIT